ncbi:MAG TPA: 50S ribosomal protein L29 [Patescibacteria group bacterium]|nr:50S ribosomal protein L29 [Patescibacteria group bacterium]
MKIKEFKDLRTKDLKTLKKMAQETKLKASKKRMEIMGGREKNLKATNNLRHDLAQILTVIREKEIIEKLQK